MIRIGVDEDQHLLASWLKEDSSLDRPTVVFLNAPPAEGEMGALTDVLEVALGPGGSVTALASSLAVWIHSRRRRVLIEVDGKKLRVDGANDVDSLAAQMLAVIKKAPEN